jgi:AraC family transcriptional regulator of arabinose operon
VARRKRRPSVQAEDVLPPTGMRREASFRNYADRSRGILACGFVVKPNVTDDIIDQITREYVAVYVLRGRGAYVDWRGESHALAAGDVLQRIPGKRHSTILDPESDWAEVYIVLHTEFFRTLVRFGSMRDDVPVLRPGLHRSLVDRFEEILRDLQSMPERSPSHTLLKAHGLILDICALDAARREPDQYAEIVQAARAVERESLGALVGSRRRRIVPHELRTLPQGVQGARRHVAR